MVVICLGPVCIPIWALLPMVLAFFNRIKSTVYSYWTGKKPESESSEPLVSTNIENTTNTNGEVIEVTSKEQWQTLLVEGETKGHTVFVDFTATWCGPCKKIAPVFASLASDNRTAVFLKVDIDAVEEVATEADVGALPTFQAYKSKTKLATFTGGHEDKLIKFVSEYA